MVWEAIIGFITSEGAVGGAIGGVLLIGISHFTNIAPDIKNKAWYSKVCYVILGALFCASIDYSAEALKFRDQLVLLIYVFIGAFWPATFMQMKNMYGTYRTGRQLQERERPDIQEMLKRMKSGSESNNSCGPESTS